MPLECIPQSELPKQEKCIFEVTVAGGFFGEDPRWKRHRTWDIVYKPEKWYSWRQLQTDEELSKEYISSLGENYIPSKELLEPLSSKKGENKIGVYEVVRGWKDSEEPNLFLYVGDSEAGSLRTRVTYLVRPPGDHTAKKTLLSYAKKRLPPGENPLDWLYIRWSVCEYFLEPVLLEYYLHLLREPCFPDKRLFPDDVFSTKRVNGECVDWTGYKNRI